MKHFNSFSGFKYISLLFAALLFLTISADAGNPKFGGFAFPIDYVDRDDETDVEVDIENTNGTYSVTGLKYNLKLYNLSDLSLAYELNLEQDELEPEKKTKVNFGPIHWDKVGIGRYRFDFSMTADFDEFPDDSEGSIEFEIRGADMLDRLGAIGVVTDYLNNKYSTDYLRNANGYIGWDVTPSGTEIKPAIGLSYDMTLTKDLWVSYINFEKYSNYSHPTALITVDPESEEVNEYYSNWWPKINGMYFPNAEQEEKDLFFGTPPERFSAGEDDHLFEITNETSNADSVCVILVVGHGQNERETNAFRNSANVMKREIQSESRGPRLGEDRIVELIDPGEIDLIEKLDELKDKYKQLYFYYVGHGDSTNGMVLKDATFPYRNFFRIVFEQNVENLDFIFDCCYSGLAVEELQADTNYRNHNVTVVTSSRRDTVSALRHVDLELKAGGIYQTGVAAMTNALSTCFGADSADRNNDGKTSLVEAMNWMKQVNPLIENGAHINDFGPQIFTHEKGETRTAALEFPNSDLRIIPNGMFVDEAQFEVTLFRGLYLFEDPVSEDIHEASKRRMWNINLKYDVENISVDLEFRYNNQYDKIESTEGTLGIIKREDENDQWTPHFPTVWNEELGTFVAVNVLKFSDWAIARVAEPSSVENQENFKYLSTEYYPNPFSESVVVNVNITKEMNLSVSLMDVLGNSIENVANGAYLPGNYKFMFDGSKLTNGVYFISINSGARREVIKLIHSK